MRNFLKKTLPLLLILICSNAWAEITITDTPDWSNTVFPETYTVGTRSNRLLVAKLLWFGGTDRNVSACTFDGVSLTKAVGSHFDIGGFFLTVEIWYLLNPNSGAKSFDYTLDGAVNGRFSSLQSVEGARQTGQPVSTSTATGNSATPVTTNITTNKEKCWIFDDIVNGGGWTSITAQSPQVDGASTFSSYKGPVGEGQNSMTWNATGSTQWNHALASFAPAPETALYSGTLYNATIN